MIEVAATAVDSAAAPVELTEAGEVGEPGRGGGGGGGMLVSPSCLLPSSSASYWPNPDRRIPKQENHHHHHLPPAPCQTTQSRVGKGRKWTWDTCDPDIFSYARLHKLGMQGWNACCLQLQMKYQHAVKSSNLASTYKTKDSFGSLSNI